MMVNYFIVLVFMALTVASNVINDDAQLKKRGFGNFLKGKVSSVGKAVKARFRKGNTNDSNNDS